MAEKLIDFISILENDSEINLVSKHGLCRLWTKRSAELARNFFEPDEWEIMAREISVCPTLDHTFLRIRHINDEKQSYFYDGTGTYKFEPYCGPEETSPEHLKINRRDPYYSYF